MHYVIGGDNLGIFLDGLILVILFLVILQKIFDPQLSASVMLGFLSRDLFGDLLLLWYKKLLTEREM